MALLRSFNEGGWGGRDQTAGESCLGSQEPWASTWVCSAYGLRVSHVLPTLRFRPHSC